MLLLCATLSIPAEAGPPKNGVYTSAAGNVLTGLFSESWIGGGRGMVGNTIHSQSWNGTSLGTQWDVSCASIAFPPVLLDDTVDETGTGHRTYRTTYTGGSFWLAGSAAWGGGDPEYSGELSFYSHVTTYQYREGVQTAYVVNAQLGGYFDGYGRCMQITIANAASSGAGSQTRAYPQFLDGAADCQAAPLGMVGEWGTVHSITLVVLDCTTSTEPGTWSTLKNLYR